jgi:hypothetical protein
MTTQNEDLKAETALNSELGRLMTLNLSPAGLMDDPLRLLRDAIGKEKEPATVAGFMWGAITHGIRHANHIDPEKTSIRWVGEIGFRTRLGTLGEADNAYLPTTVERKLRNAGAPVVNEGEEPPHGGFVAEFSVQYVCVPYTPPPGKSGAPFTYACRNLQERRRSINHLAPPQVQMLLPPEPAALLGYDPDTGEVTDIDSEQQEAAQ